MPKVSIIISVYKKVKELELIFAALSVQSFSEFEVIIAEDGADNNIKGLVDEWKGKDIFDIIHLTQEDSGFRKNKILNAAIRKSGTDYLIFFDGDCIPHFEFVKAHYENRQTDTVLCGRRVNLTKKLSERINKENILKLNYFKTSISEIIYSSLNRHKNGFNFNAEEGFIIKNKFFRNLITNKDEHILGCNFSVHKNVLEKINGFDENYEGPGLGEDSDIEYRMRLINIKFKSVRNLAVQYHMYHPKTIESGVNMEYFQKVKLSNKFFCKNGLSKSE